MSVQRWRILAEGAFGVVISDSDSIDLLTARKFATKIHYEMLDKKFLTRLDAAVAALTDLDPQAKMTCIVSMKMEVLRALLHPSCYVVTPSHIHWQNNCLSATLHHHVLTSLATSLARSPPCFFAHFTLQGRDGSHAGVWL